MMNRLHLNFVSIWVQIHVLPLEYQYPELAERMGHMIGAFEKIDWEDRLPQNIRFMRVKVRLNLWMPVVSGFMLCLDDGTRTWIQCRYEKVHKLCTKCSPIRHTKSQCSESMDKVKRILIRQRHWIQHLHQVPFGFDSLEPQFHNELRAYFNKRRSWTTRARFGNMEQEHQVQSHPSPATFNPEPPNFTSPTPAYDTNHHISPEPKPSTMPNPSTQIPNIPHPTNLQPDFEHATLNSYIFPNSRTRFCTTHAFQFPSLIP